MAGEQEERDRITVLRYLFDQDRIASSRYWNSDEISSGTGLSVEDVEYQLDTLDDDGLADVLRSGAGNYAALISSAGKRLIREGPRVVAPSVAIGAIIHQMSGGNVQGVGNAVNSEVSQVVNDPGDLSRTLDELGEKLLAEVRAELQERDLEDYTRAVQDLKAELMGRKNAGRVKRLLRTLALMGDVEGSIGLMVRLWPLVGATGALAQGLGIA